MAEPKLDIGFPYDVPSDDLGNPTASTLLLFEDGHPLGPGHSLHDEIRKEGRGRYSHWGSNLYFSASDNTNPHTNGREYAIQVTPALHPALLISVLASIALCAVTFRRSIYALWQRRAPQIVVSGVLTLAALYVLAAFGIVGPFKSDLVLIGSREIALSICLHGFIGAALLVQWIALGGLAYMAVARRRNIPFYNVFLMGFPFSVGLTAATTIISIYCLSWFSTLVWLATVPAFALLWRPGKCDLRKTLTDALLILPFAVSLCVFFGLAWHGPLGGTPGALLGDDAIYTGLMNALSTGHWPVPNLGVEGEMLVSLNFLGPAIAAAWAWLPNFESQLFFATSLSFLFAYFAMLTVVTLMDYGLTQGRRPFLASEILVVASLVGAGTKYGSWSVEFPPFVFFIPIVGTIFVLCRSRTGMAAATTTALVGTALSKIAAFPVAMGYIVGAYSAELRIVLRRSYALQILVIIIVLYITVMTTTSLPWLLKQNVIGTQLIHDLMHGASLFSLDSLIIFLREIGLFLVFGIMVWLPDRGLRYAGLIAWAEYAFSAFSFAISAVTAFWFAAATILVTSEIGARSRWGLFVGAVLGFPYVASAFGGWPILAIWPCFAAITVFALAFRRSPAVASRMQQIWPVSARTTILCVLATVAILAVGISDRGVYVTSSTRLTYTPELRDIWRATRRYTPQDALIFTDQTGAGEDRLKGWNDFALQASRQFFVVSWATSTAHSDEKAKRIRLQLNNQVLAGSLSPDRVPVSGAYSAFYAVVSRGRAVPGRSGSSTKMTNSVSIALTGIESSRRTYSSIGR